MAKAQIKTPEGILIEVHGSPAEITAVVGDLKKQARRGTMPKHKKGRLSRVSLTNLIESLIDGRFFTKPRTLAEIKNALAEMGHHYPVTTLSGAMLTQVRRKNVRRLKTNKVWSCAR